MNRLEAEDDLSADLMTDIKRLSKPVKKHFKIPNIVDEDEISDEDFIEAAALETDELKEAQEKIANLSAMVEDLSAMLKSQVQDDDERYQIIVTTREGRFAPYVERSDSIIGLKVMIYGEKGIPLEDQRLMYNVRQLEDDKTLGHYGIIRLCASRSAPRAGWGSAPAARDPSCYLSRTRTRSSLRTSSTALT